MSGRFSKIVSGDRKAHGKDTSFSHIWRFKHKPAQEEDFLFLYLKNVSLKNLAVL